MLGDLIVTFDGSGSVYNDTRWYLVSVSWYCLVLGGSGSANVSLPVYIGKNGDLIG